MYVLINIENKSKKKKKGINIIIYLIFWHKYYFKELIRTLSLN